LLTQVKQTHESNLKELVNIANQISINESIKPFFALTDANKAVELMGFLKPYSIINEFCNNQYLIFNNDKYLYSYKTSISIELFLQKGVIYSSIDSENLENLFENKDVFFAIPSQPAKGILIDKEENIVSFIVPLNKRKEGKMLFIISEDQYIKMFSQKTMDYQNFYILFNNKVIVKKETFQFPYSEIENAIHNLPDNYYVQKIMTGNKEFLITAAKGDFDMWYSAILPTEQLNQALYDKQKHVWIFLLPLGFISVILTIFFSLRNYKPIKKIRRLVENTEKNDDLESIEIGIQNLINENKNLHSDIEQISLLKRYEVIINFIHDNYHSREEFIERAYLAKMNTNTKYFAISLAGTFTKGLLNVQMDPNDYSYEQSIVNKNDIDNLFYENYVREKFSVNIYCIDLVYKEQKLIVLFANQPKNIISAIKNAHQKIHKKKPKHVTSISEIHENINKGSIAFLEASAAYDNRFIKGNSNVLWFSDLSLVGESIPYPSKQMNFLKASIKYGNLSDINDSIIEIMKYLELSKSSLFSFRALYTDIFKDIVRELSPPQDCQDKLKMYNIFNLSDCLSIEEIGNMLHDFCQLYSSIQIQTGKLYRNNANYILMKEIEDFMQSHFAEQDLSITCIAEKFNLSPAHLSINFKKCLGILPSDNLTQIRIENAIKLLESTKLSVKDVSIKVGYHDVSGFIKRFRKLAGMTPKKYRITRGSDETFVYSRFSDN
jgi:two-component system response regulator YesN